MRSGIVPGALEGVLYAVWSLLLLWPVTLHLNDRTIGTGDAEYYAWLGWRLGELMKAGSSPLFIPDVIYPEGYDLLLGDGLGAYLALGVVSAMTGPFLGLNLTVALSSFLNCLVGRRLARVAGTTDRTVWIVTALAFAGSPAIVTRAAGHFHLTFAFVAGLVVAEAIRVASGQSLRVFVTGALLALAFYISVYWLISSVVAFVVIVLVAAVRGRSLGSTAGRGVRRFSLRLS